MSDGKKFEYTMVAHAAGDHYGITIFVNDRIATLAKDGWELHQVNPTVIGVSDGYNGTRPQYDVMVMFRRPVEQHPMDQVVGQVRP